MEKARKSLADNLIKIRELRKLSQEKLAALSHVPRRTIQNIEYGETLSPELDTLKGLAKALNVTVSDLIDEEGQRSLALEMAQVADFLSKYAALPLGLQRMVQALVYQNPSFVRNLEVPLEELKTLRGLLGPLAKAKS